MKDISNQLLQVFDLADTIVTQVKLLEVDKRVESVDCEESVALKEQEKTTEHYSKPWSVITFHITPMYL